MLTHACTSVCVADIVEHIFSDLWPRGWWCGRQWWIQHRRVFSHISNYHISYHIISYHIVVLKRQNCLKVGTDKPKLKGKVQSVSDDDVRKRLLEKPRFELAVKGVLGRCYILRQGVTGLWAINWESTAKE